MSDEPERSGDEPEQDERTTGAEQSPAGGESHAHDYDELNRAMQAGEDV